MTDDEMLEIVDTQDRSLNEILQIVIDQLQDDSIRKVNHTPDSGKTI